MSTYRVFAARVINLGRLAISRLWSIGWSSPTFGKLVVDAVPVGKVVRTVLKAAPRFVGRVPAQPPGLLSRQVWQAFRAGGFANVRAASIGLWRRGSRQHGLNRAKTTNALLWAQNQSATNVFDRIRDFFGSQLSETDANLPQSLRAYDVGSMIAKGCNGAVHEAKVLPSSGAVERRSGDSGPETDRRKEYPLAVKLMFNYDYSAPDESVWVEMAPELVPVLDKGVQKKLSGSFARYNYTAIRESHPNLVRIHTAFVDDMPVLPDGHIQYPDALPLDDLTLDNVRHLTMFMIMKRYAMTLRQYLLMYESSAESSHVMLGQLLEALVFLYEHKISHRDLKSDNILVDFDIEGEVPHLVVSDFGTCLARNSFKIPYEHADTDLGGNVQLRAPEIRCSVPARYRELDFSKADLWAAGALAYEIFTKDNPFYMKMRSDQYAESDLPLLPNNVHYAVSKLVSKMLKRDPARRPSPHCAADVVSLSLFRFKDFYNLMRETGFSLTLEAKDLWNKLDQLMSLYAAETLLGARLRSKSESVLRQTFLARLDKTQLWSAIINFYLPQTLAFEPASA